MWCCEACQRNPLPPSSGKKGKLSMRKNSADVRRRETGTGVLRVPIEAWAFKLSFSTLKIEAAESSGILLTNYHTT
jgi:hypothetical protein